MTTSLDLIDVYLEAIAAKRNVVIATIVDVRGDFPDPVTARIVVPEEGDPSGSFVSAALQAGVVQQARELIRAGRSKTVTFHLDGAPTGRRDRAVRDEPGVDVYFEVTLGQLTLLVVGGGHVGACLAKVAKYAGWRTVVLDDRPDFANAERHPDADEVICDDYAEALARYPISAATSIVAVTRGHKHDEIAIRSVVDSPARYVGMIGSKRRVTTVLRHLEEEGVSAEALARVWTPIGLDIGAETPEEIAISIVAEMIMVRRGGKGGPMRGTRPGVRPRATVEDTEE